MNERQVFNDPSGRRVKGARLLGLVFFAVVSAAAAVFALSLATNVAMRPAQFAKRVTDQTHITNRVRQQLNLRALRQRMAQLPKVQPKEPVPGRAIALGFFAPWEEGALASLRVNVGHLTHLSPVWLSLGEDGASLDERDFDPITNPSTREVITLAREHGVRLVPVLANAVDGDFKPDRVRQLLKSETAQSALADQLIAWCRREGFQGINLDFEQVEPQNFPAYVHFVQGLKSKFAAASLELSVDLEANAPSDAIPVLAAASDYLVVMAYDEHEESGPPGPIASIEFTERLLDTVLKDVPEDKVVLGIGSYAYDWTEGEPTAESLSYEEAMATASGYREGEDPSEVVQWDGEAGNAWFTYADDKDRKHTVWMLDALSFYNQAKLGRARGLRGVALWSVGSEDPAVWSVVSAAQTDPRQLATVRFPFVINYTGKGEALKVVAQPRDGKRDVSVDADSGLVDDVVYTDFPSAYLIRKSGYKPKKLVLTFDDGPDPRFTPGILDVLRAKHAPAAFFCTGENVALYPDLARRIVDEGHEIGNHSFTHPNLGTLEPQRVALEINSTIRAIEAATGRSSILFRPPYNADSQPQTSEEVKPVVAATALGLQTIGENIDPQDWNPSVERPDGTTRPKTADDIVTDVLKQITAREAGGEEGNVILLHDAGGDREATVRALPAIIDGLRSKGYEFVSVGETLDLPREKVQPPVVSSERLEVGVDSAVFNTMRVARAVMTTAFSAAIVLGVLRILLVIPLALAHRRTAKALPGGTNHTVAVVIAAYNEEATILRTLESILASHKPPDQVIVVDDGSTDRTLEVLREAGLPGVQVLTKPNGGKASALTLGLEACTCDLALSVDADTLLHPDALELLARHFADPKVGAVAGQVEVGNVGNVVTAWQAVEYRTSQNLDRRAYALLNAVSVVPGAVGMWRLAALREAGGFTSDTLAEDMDLTWRVRMLGYRIETEPGAIARTEAPETVRSLFKQRLRWSFGALQCLWKHRRALGRFGYFGTVQIPSMWLFQVVFQALGPAVDVQILFSGLVAFWVWRGSAGQEISTTAQFESLWLMAELYALFFCLELVAGVIAYRLDRAKPWPLVWLFIQRFVYRQLMYLVMIRALANALVGRRQGWRKLQRTGSVKGQ